MVLRLPSLLATALSAVAAGPPPRSAGLISREAARATVLVFAATRAWVAFEASEARPYAIATLAVIGSTYALVRWLDDGGIACPLAILYAIVRGRGGLDALPVRALAARLKRSTRSRASGVGRPR